MKEKRILSILVETPLHAGSGSELGLVDLPIQRERHTGFPKIESSTLKGSLRDALEWRMGNKNAEITVLFGPDGEEARNNPRAGAMALSDARLLLFPVRSLIGVWAWVTCPAILQRLLRDLQLMNKNCQELQQLIQQVCQIDDEHVVVPGGSVLIIRTGQQGEEVVVLEDYRFKIKKISNSDKLKLLEYLKAFIPNEEPYKPLQEMEKRLVILSDNSFSHFVEHTTEVIARVALDDDTRTVREGALWYEEYLPQNTLLYSMVFFSDFSDKPNNQVKKAEEMAKFFEEAIKKLKYIQIGGNLTIGKGFVRLHIFKDLQSGSGS